MATVTTIRVRGFPCPGCAENVKQALLRLEGVIKADADFATERVEVRYDPDRVTEEALHDRIRSAGFDPA